MEFLLNNWSNILLIIVGASALFTYILQEHKKKIDAASLIVLQIDELQERLREISTYIVDGKLNDTAFYESLPLMEDNYWNKYKHYFVRAIDHVSYSSLNQLFNYASEIQEQQLLVKSLQKNSFFVIQAVYTNIETNIIMEEVNHYETPLSANTWQQKKAVLNEMMRQDILTKYFPIQLRISLEKVLNECALLEIKGTDGYRILKKMSNKKW